jgi:hypothetical protein
MEIYRDVTRSTTGAPLPSEICYRRVGRGMFKAMFIHLCDAVYALSLDWPFWNVVYKNVDKRP